MAVVRINKPSREISVHLRVCLRSPSISMFRMQVAGSALAAVVMLTGTAHGSQDAVETIGIMKFINVTSEAKDHWIGVGIAEALASDLPVRLVAVLDVDIADESLARRVLRELDVKWFIAGSYQRVGDDLRIITKLIDAKTGIVAHTFEVDGPFEELFTLQDQIVAKLSNFPPTQLAPPGSTGTVPTDGVSALSVPPRLAPPGPIGTVPTDSAPVTFVSSTATELSRPVEIIDGPPPPVPPAVVSRDAAGRTTVRAVRLAAPLRLDGVLDEHIYTDLQALSDFIQQEPNEGEPATEKTEAWVLFDDNNIYISTKAWDSAPESQWIANEMRRDSTNILRNEGIHFTFDTFYDRRNGYVFNVNPLGGRLDGQTTLGRTWNGDWNPLWDVRTGRFEGGWTMEAAIPFKSLRYRPGRAQIWGFNIRRVVRWKNEMSALTLLPVARGLPAQLMMSLSATLVGLEVPVRTRGTIEIKPYAISEVAGTQRGSPELSNDVAGNLGFDIKYGISQNLVADLTVNTDFAQVEADEQQVNLTRFSLFFPEKREFFLENQGTFIFGGSTSYGYGGGGSDAPVLFYSREIGLNQGQVVPIDAGGRITGRIGKFSVGFLNIQTSDAPDIGARATNFTVARVQRDILRRSSAGFLFTGRSVSKSGVGSSETYGVDGVFAFYDNLNINTYWAKTTTPGLSDDDVSYRAELDYVGDRYGVKAERLVVGRSFNPEVGFIRRRAFDRRFGLFRFSPRPARISAVRKFTFQGQVAYIMDRSGLLETRENQGEFGVELENSDAFKLTYTESYEFLKQPFRIAPGVTLPTGGYSFQDAKVSFTLGPTRKLVGTVSVQHGSFFSGNKTTIGFNRGRLGITPQLSLEPSVSYNLVDTPEGRFTTNLVTTRAVYTMSPRMFVSALLQYNSSTNSLATNVRLRWEYLAGSELFVVYNEERDTLAPMRLSQPENRAFVVKINRLFRF